jgi:hypothetical protein
VKTAVEAKATETRAKRFYTAIHTAFLAESIHSSKDHLKIYCEIFSESRDCGIRVMDIARCCKNLQYIDGHNTSSSYLIQFYSNTPYDMNHIFPGEAPIRKTLFSTISHITTFT